MHKVKILFIGSDEKIVNIVTRLINSNSEWQGYPATSLEDAKHTFIMEKFNMVLFGAGIDEDSGKEMRCFCEAINPEILLVEHYGGGSGLLYSEINYALDKKDV